MLYLAIYQCCDRFSQAIADMMAILALGKTEKTLSCEEFPE
ncbi:hypothetical protein [Nostoc sp. CHAB 5836]|nr:hypothetical protein [Nostoc sp. CHAB 5836]